MCDSKMASNNSSQGIFFQDIRGAGSPKIPVVKRGELFQKLVPVFFRELLDRALRLFDPQSPTIKGCFYPFLDKECLLFWAYSGYLGKRTDRSVYKKEKGVKGLKFFITDIL